ncbi:MAG TPA: Xaa-Pro peptidase family protein [Phycisphaerae bacterium]|nr:Xaa-Pro peptidase family protein [Phycisphaerae bacterium]HRW52270.1 Xaa-Pro peptidase family protein [Phycisphaerae bacterium]
MTTSLCISDSIVANHVDRLTVAMAGAGVDGCFLFNDRTLLGFCNLPFGPSDRLVCALVNQRGESALVIPAFEVSAVERIGDRCEIFPWDEHEDPYQAVAAAAASLGIERGRILLDPRTWLDVRDRLQDRLSRATLETDYGILERIRMIKSAEEIGAIRLACAHCSIVFDHAAALLGAGATEDQVFQSVSDRLAMEGAMPEIVLIQSGPNGAVPHLPTGVRTIRRGDSVVVDCVCRRNGYCGDMTRTYLINETDEELRRACATVRQAHDAALAFIRPGVTAHQVDATARAIIDRAGFGRAFLHRLGHGIGLEGHEPPFIVRGSDVVLEAGMCFTIEPGIYVSDAFGVRLESVVTVTPDGCEMLSDLTPLDVSCEPENAII